MRSMSLHKETEVKSATRYNDDMSKFTVVRGLKVYLRVVTAVPGRLSMKQLPYLANGYLGNGVVRLQMLNYVRGI
jgi:hypothetical protein